MLVNAATERKTSLYRELPCWKRAKIGNYGWIWIGTVVLFAVSFLIAPGSVTPGALRAMLPFAGILAIVAVGQTLVIQQRGIDMSAVGSLTSRGNSRGDVGLRGSSPVDRDPRNARHRLGARRGQRAAGHARQHSANRDDPSDKCPDHRSCSPDLQGRAADRADAAPRFRDGANLTACPTRSLSPLCSLPLWQP